MRVPFDVDLVRKFAQLMSECDEYDVDPFDADQMIACSNSGATTRSALPILATFHAPP